MYFAPGTAVRIISDVRWDVPSSRCSVEGRVEPVEWLVGVERVSVKVEDASEERRPASLVCQDDNVLGCELSCCLGRCDDLRETNSLRAYF